MRERAMCGCARGREPCDEDGRGNEEGGWGKREERKRKRERENTATCNRCERTDRGAV